MKRLIIIRNSEYFNNSSMQRIFNALKSYDFEISIIERSRKKTSKNSYKELVESSKKIKVHTINQKDENNSIMKLVDVLKYNIKLYRIFNRYYKNSNGFIHSFDLDTILPLIVFKKKFKIIYHIADFYADSRNLPAKLKNILRKLEIFTTNKVDAVIICTEERKAQIKGTENENINIIYNTPIINKERLYDETSNGKITLGYIGNLSSRRFINEILRACSENDNIELIIGGNGELKQQAEKFANRFENITFVGETTIEQTYELYNQVDIILSIYDPKISNHKYSAPNKLYEAIILNKAIITAKDMGIDKLVSENKIGYVIDYNFESFKNLLNSINKNELNSYKNNTNKLYNEYSWENQRIKIQKLYEDLYNEK